MKSSDFLIQVIRTISEDTIWWLGVEGSQVGVTVGGPFTLAGSPVLLSWLCLIREAIKLAPSHRQQPGLFVTTSTINCRTSLHLLEWRYSDQLGTHL